MHAGHPDAAKKDRLNPCLVGLLSCLLGFSFFLRVAGGLLLCACVHDVVKGISRRRRRRRRRSWIAAAIVVVRCVENTVESKVLDYMQAVSVTKVGRGVRNKRHKKSKIKQGGAHGRWRSTHARPAKPTTASQPAAAVNSASSSGDGSVLGLCCCDRGLLLLLFLRRFIQSRGSREAPQIAFPTTNCSNSSAVKPSSLPDAPAACVWQVGCLLLPPVCIPGIAFFIQFVACQILLLLSLWKPWWDSGKHSLLHHSFRSTTNLEFLILWFSVICIVRFSTFPLSLAQCASWVCFFPAIETMNNNTKSFMWMDLVLLSCACTPYHLCMIASADVWIEISSLVIL
jgi:hypothetical protein